MEAITVAQIASALAILAGIITSVGVIIAAINKYINKRVAEEIAKINDPIKTALAEIKQQNEDLKKQGNDTRNEIILIMKLNQTMIGELKTLGHVNGETSQALQELNDYLINK